MREPDVTAPQNFLREVRKNHQLEKTFPGNQSQVFAPNCSTGQVERNFDNFAEFLSNKVQQDLIQSQKNIFPQSTKNYLLEKFFINQNMLFDQ